MLDLCRHFVDALSNLVEALGAGCIDTDGGLALTAL
jgi:hypothetical protein